MADCKHEKFKADVVVIKFEDLEGKRVAKIVIQCAECGERMRFKGMDTEINIDGASVSKDGFEARLGIEPESDSIVYNKNVN